MALWRVPQTSLQWLPLPLDYEMSFSLTSFFFRLFPPVRRLILRFHEMSRALERLETATAHLQNQQQQLLGVVVSTSKALGAVTSRQEAAAGLQAQQAASNLPTVEPHPSYDSDIEKATAREIQLAAETYLPLLMGDLVIEPDRLRVLGIGIAPDGLAASVRFFLNGRPFDDVEYPLADDLIASRFSELSGAAAFRAVLRINLHEVLESRFFRIDMSSTGAYVPADWRRAIWMTNPAFERFPFPPAENMRRVVGDDRSVRFAMGGATIFHNVAAYLREMGRDLKEFRSILDWGCGAGRITRYLIGETSATVYGGDIDEANISWCAKNLTGGVFYTFPLTPPTQLADASIDLVIGASVLTHLAEPAQFEWLSELKRITQPGALLFLSVAGAVQFAHQGYPAAFYQQIQVAGFVDHTRDPALDGYIKDVEFYRSVWHSRPYIIQHWSRFFDVLAFIDGIAALQDFVVLRRR
jgi:SAM-dependent methyltransferase